MRCFCQQAVDEMVVTDFRVNLTPQYLKLASPVEIHLTKFLKIEQNFSFPAWSRNPFKL